MDGIAQHWVRGPVIGRGATATVSLATCSLTGSTFAVKSADIRHSASLQREQRFLASIPPSAYVVPYFGFDVTSECDGNAVYNLFLELAPNGSVADEIARCGRLEQGKVRNFARDILLGLTHLHSNGIAHCDVKPRNVLVTADGTSCKLADLGCAKLVANDKEFAAEWEVSTSRTIGGSPMYMAPEVARGEEQGMAADVWAVGCTVIEMATGRAPWPDVKDPVSAMHRIGFSDDTPQFLSAREFDGAKWADARDFLEKCLVRHPSVRWTAEELLAHPFTTTSGVGKGEDNDGFFPASQLDTNWRWRPSPKCVLDGDNLWGCCSTSTSTTPAESESEDDRQIGLPATATHSSTPRDRIGQLAGPSTSTTWADATMSGSSWAWSSNKLVHDNHYQGISTDVGGEWITIRARHSGGRTDRSLSPSGSEPQAPTLAGLGHLAGTNLIANTTTPSSRDYRAPTGAYHYCHLQYLHSCTVEKKTAMHLPRDS